MTAQTSANLEVNNAWINTPVLVPDNNVQNIACKHHKTDEKPPILRCKFLHQYLDFFLNESTTPSPLLKIW